MIQTTEIRRGAPHPSTTRRTPSRNDDFFDEAELRSLRAYIAPLRRNRRIRLAISTAVDLGLIFGLKLAPRIDHSVSGLHWTLRLLLISLVFGLLEAIPKLPFSWWANLVYEKKAGHSTMTPKVWAKDQLLDQVLGVVITAILLLPVYAAIRWYPATWWALGGLVVAVVMVTMAFLAPVVIMPRFNTFTPLPDGPIRSRIEELARASEVDVEGVYLMDASKRTTRANAGVTGFGKTKRVIVNDTICEFPIEELSQVIAHELGHYRLNHVPKGFPLTVLPFPLAFLFVQLITAHTGILSWAGVADLGDPGSYALFGLLIGLPMTLTDLASKWQSRTYEREADREALELLGDPTSFVSVWPRMVLNDKANLEPTPWERLTSTHPEIAERMQYGLDWAGMNNVTATPPPLRSVPTPGATTDEKQSDPADV